MPKREGPEVYDSTNDFNLDMVYYGRLRSERCDITDIREHVPRIGSYHGGTQINPHAYDHNPIHRLVVLSITMNRIAALALLLIASASAFQTALPVRLAPPTVRDFR